jgi:Cu/Ag efflux protein CusF
MPGCPWFQRAEMTEMSSQGQRTVAIRPRYFRLLDNTPTHARGFSQEVFRMKSVIATFLISIFVPGGFVLAGSQDQGMVMGSLARMQGDSTGQGMPMSEGLIIKVDKASGRITIRHGELYNLGMPAMTMAFRVSKPAMLNLVKPGDAVQFRADRRQGALTITDLETKSP